MFKGYEARRRGSLRYCDKTINRDQSVIRDFLAFTGRAPWELDENDFDVWCYDDLVLSRRLKPASQRTYQSAVRGFFEYLVGNRTFQARTEQLTSRTVHQICTDENCIPHLGNHERSQHTRSMTHEEIEQFFSAIDREIKGAALFRSKSLLPLMRDKAMFYCQYCGSLRISENRGLEVGSFRPNPSLPGLKSYGSTSVLGKGSRGSGPKHRTVPTTQVQFADVMQWYLEAVRPRFLEKAKDPNEQALFLSERGRRISVSAMEYRFQHLIDLAGLGGRGFTTHSLRGSGVTHLGLMLSIETIRAIVGHVYATTTLGYMQIPEKFAQQEIEAAVTAQLELVRSQEPVKKEGEDE
jgi:site-specific recombinase XerD